MRLEVDGAIGWLIFDHEARRNAMTLNMWNAVPALCAQLEADPKVRVVVLRGAGERAFVAGADISQFNDERTPEKAGAYNEANGAAYGAISELTKPVIAMIHGFCIGGGLAIALCADIRYVADDARLALPPAKLGIGYAADGIGGLVDLVGPAVAKEIVYTADLADADQALAWGLVNRVVAKASLESFVREQCATMASRAPLSQAAAKLAIDDYLRAEPDKKGDAVQAAITRCMDSDDYKEGVAAFLAKRPPNFEGR